MALREAPLVRIQPRSETLYVTQGNSVLSTALDGFVHPENVNSPLGLFVRETRLLSRYEIKINGKRLHPVALSNVEQHSWLGYYTTSNLDIFEGVALDMGSGRVPEESERTLEVRISRYVGAGVHEDIDITNYTQAPLRFELSIEADGDFADQMEIGYERLQTGKIERNWLDDPNEGRGSHEWEGELSLRYEASHHYSHQGNEGDARIRRGIILHVHNAQTRPRFTEGSIKFPIELKPCETWHSCIDFVPEFDGKRLAPHYTCRSFGKITNIYDEEREQFFQTSSRIGSSSNGVAETVVRATQQARHDLATMRLHDFDTKDGGWTMAAGLPIYVSLYGRDTLTASWQAAVLGPEMMIGSLEALARLQGDRVDDWLDEQPGRMIHERHEGPLAALKYNPFGANYGATTTSHVYPFLVSELWHWTGDKELVSRFIKPAMKALDWADRYGDRDGDGFYEYLTRSEQGVRHQGWKDSANAVVDELGRQVAPPIAMCEEQAFVYVSKLHLAETLWWLDYKHEAKRLYREANELKKRFNEAYWNESIGYFAMALGPKKEQVLSIGSDPGHCLASGIVDKSLARRTADRMMQPDLFSGWGVRTLSSDNPAFNPYSYHRGSVWPVENGTFALAFMRHGFHDHMHRLARSFFEATSLFEFNRPPEVFSGHPRDGDHPFPALYPKSNSPQAWSSTATFAIVQALLGLYPYAPLKTLVVDPHLPEWLPHLELKDLRVGQARVSLSFYRRDDGTSDYKITDQEGALHIVRQPSPWSLTATWTERISDGMTSLFH